MTVSNSYISAYQPTVSWSIQVVCWNFADSQGFQCLRCGLDQSTAAETRKFQVLDGGVTDLWRDLETESVDDKTSEERNLWRVLMYATSNKYDNHDDHDDNDDGDHDDDDDDDDADDAAAVSVWWRLIMYDCLWWCLYDVWWCLYDDVWCMMYLYDVRCLMWWTMYDVWCMMGSMGSIGSIIGLSHEELPQAESLYCSWKGRTEEAYCMRFMIRTSDMMQHVLICI